VHAVRILTGDSLQVWQCDPERNRIWNLWSSNETATSESSEGTKPISGVYCGGWQWGRIVVSVHIQVEHQLKSLISSLFTTPTEQLKIRQQSTLDNSRLPSVWKIARDIYKQKGIKGLYRGYTPTAGRELGYGAYFFTVSLIALLDLTSQLTTHSTKPFAGASGDE
jgi:Mitochondrial carrier protein